MTNVFLRSGEMRIGMIYLNSLELTVILKLGHFIYDSCPKFCLLYHSIPIFLSKTSVIKQF